MRRFLIILLVTVTVSAVVIERAPPYFTVRKAAVAFVAYAVSCGNASCQAFDASPPQYRTGVFNAIMGGISALAAIGIQKGWADIETDRKRSLFEDIVSERLKESLSDDLLVSLSTQLIVNNGTAFTVSPEGMGIYIDSHSKTVVVKTKTDYQHGSLLKRDDDDIVVNYEEYGDNGKALPGTPWAEFAGEMADNVVYRGDGYKLWCTRFVSGNGFGIGELALTARENDIDQAALQTSQCW